MKKLMVEVMGRYAEVIDNTCIAMGEHVEAACRAIVKYGKYVLALLVVVLVWILMAATIPIWYLPYKYFAGKGE